jgi:VIT1/CCC1 family predicted Fe2+/Mn2+ transporter
MKEMTKPALVLNPLDRAAEILFGLIMTLTFTCSIGIANKGATEIKQLLIGAVGCNLAWGIVDATMYLIGVLAQKSRSKVIWDSVHDPLQATKAREYISGALPSTVASSIGTQGIEEIRNRLINAPEIPVNVRLTISDVKKAIAIFSLVFISTFPVVIPFIFIHDTKLALRISNLVAIVMMFLCGWSVGKYVGLNKWKVSFATVSIGILLVGVTIVLGG